MGEAGWTIRETRREEYIMRYLAMAAAALAVAAVPASAQNPAPGAALTASPSVQEFVKQAAMTNLYEIDAGKLAEEKAADGSYRNYAKMIVTDHTKMNNDLKSEVATMQNVQLPTSLDALHREKLQQLKSEQGAGFERNFRAGQIEGHEAAITLFENFAQSGSNPDLKAMARSSVAILQKHLQRAENLPEPNGPAVGAAEPAHPSTTSSKAASTTAGE
jgi:putative membrane protein